MKHALLSLLILSAPLAVRAEDAPAAAPVAPADTNQAPAIVCDQPSYDFGTMESSQTVTHDYVIVNKGNATLEISQARPSCGCTVASISTKSVPPGGETRITAQLNLAGRMGQQHKTITVESNDPKQPQLTLTLQGNIGDAVSVQPNQVTFGQIGAEGVNTREVTISSGNGQPLKVLTADSSSPNFTAELQTREEGKTYAVIVATKGPLVPGSLNAAIHVTTDNPSKQQFDIPVAAIITGDLIVAPQDLTIQAQPDQTVTRYLIVRSANNAPFEVKSVETPDASITYQVFPFGVNGYRIQLDNIKATHELDGKSVKVTTSVESMKEITVPFHIVGT